MPARKSKWDPRQCCALTSSFLGMGEGNEVYMLTVFPYGATVMHGTIVRFVMKGKQR